MKKAILSICVMLLFASCQEKLSENRKDKASIPASFDFESMKLKTITTFIDPKKQTTSTLYGNQVAYEKLLIFVTWKLEEDAKWFGAMVPGEILTIEKLKSNNFSTDKSPEYQKLNGKTLQKDLTITGQDMENRIKLILSLKPAVTP